MAEVRVVLRDEKDGTVLVKPAGDIPESDDMDTWTPAQRIGWGLLAWARPYAPNWPMVAIDFYDACIEVLELQGKTLGDTDFDFRREVGKILRRAVDSLAPVVVADARAQLGNRNPGESDD